ACAARRQPVSRRPAPIRACPTLRLSLRAAGIGALVGARAARRLAAAAVGERSAVARFPERLRLARHSERAGRAALTRMVEKQRRASRRFSVIVTNGVSCLQTNKYNSTCWPYCHGHALPPSWLQACNPARNGGAHDHHGFYHGVVL